VVIEVKDDELALTDAVESYLFNSQLVTLSPDRMALICPMDCREFETAARALEAIIAGDNPIGEVEFVEVRQSMRNGGGPACLRLRVVLTEAQMAAAHAGVLMTPVLYEQLVAWVERHYRDELRPDDLRDAELIEESRAALDELTQLLGLEGLYRFQGLSRNGPNPHSVFSI